MWESGQQSVSLTALSTRVTLLARLAAMMAGPDNLCFAVHVLPDIEYMAMCAKKVSVPSLKDSFKVTTCEEVTL